MLCWVYCETNIDDCFSNACVNGVCRDGISGYECECESQQMTGYHCEVWCPSGLSGDFCQIPTPLCDNTTNLCQKEEHVWRGQGAGITLVFARQSTQVVFDEQENTCNSIECFNGGSCVTLDDGGLWVCVH